MHFVGSVSQILTLSQSFGDRPTPIPPTGHVTSVATITRTTVAGSKAQDRKPMPTVSTTTMPTYIGQVSYHKQDKMLWLLILFQC